MFLLHTDNHGLDHTVFTLHTDIIMGSDHTVFTLHTDIIMGRITLFTFHTDIIMGRIALFTLHTDNHGSDHTVHTSH